MQDHQSAGCPAANTQAASERWLRLGVGLEGSDGRLVQPPYSTPHSSPPLPSSTCIPLSFPTTSVTALSYSCSRLGEDDGWGRGLAGFNRSLNGVAVGTTRTQNFWRSHDVVSLSSKHKVLKITQDGEITMNVSIYGWKVPFSQDDSITKDQWFPTDGSWPKSESQTVLAGNLCFLNYVAW